MDLHKKAHYGSVRSINLSIISARSRLQHCGELEQFPPYGKQGKGQWLMEKSSDVWGYCICSRQKSLPHLSFTPQLRPSGPPSNLARRKSLPSLAPGSRARADAPGISSALPKRGRLLQRGSRDVASTPANGMRSQPARRLHRPSLPASPAASLSKGPEWRPLVGKRTPAGRSQAGWRSASGSPPPQRASFSRSRPRQPCAASDRFPPATHPHSGPDL